MAALQPLSLRMFSQLPVYGFADFINRQMADVNVRRSQHVASKAAVEEEEQVKKVTAALQCVACCCHSSTLCTRVV